MDLNSAPSAGSRCLTSPQKGVEQSDVPQVKNWNRGYGRKETPRHECPNSYWWKFWVKKDRAVWISLLMLILGLVISSFGYFVAMAVKEDGCSTSPEWFAFALGCLIDIFGMATLYSGLLSLLHKIKPAQRSGSIVAKIAAIVLCVVLYLLFTFVVGVTGAKHFSVWDFLIFFALCSAIWRGVVGEKNGRDCKEQDEHAIRKDVPDMEIALGCWIVLIVIIVVVIAIFAWGLNGDQKGDTPKVDQYHNQEGVVTQDAKKKEWTLADEYRDQESAGTPESRNKPKTYGDYFGGVERTIDPQQRLKQRLDLSDELERKASFIADETEGNEQFAEDHRFAVKARDILSIHKINFANLSDEEIKVLSDGINRRYDAAMRRKRNLWK